MEGCEEIIMAMTTRIMFPILAASLFSGLLGSAQTAHAIDINDCTVISTSGTYNLVAHITDVTATKCIEITVSNVTLNGNDYQVTGKDTVGTHGLHVSGTGTLTNININNVHVRDFDSGIYLDGVNSSTVEECQSNSNPRAGFELTNSNNNSLNNNEAISNGTFGVLLVGGSEQNTVTDSTINWQGQGIQCGQYASNANNNYFSNNFIGYNQLGIDIQRCAGIEITGNELFGNFIGIFMDGSTDSTVTRNTVDHHSYDHDFVCISLTASKNNLIYDNYFNCETDNVTIRGGGHLTWPNNWSIPKESGTNIVGGPYRCGNYWDDYSGWGSGVSADCYSDAEPDYLCDYGFTIDTYNADPCPLIEPDLVVNISSSKSIVTPGSQVTLSWTSNVTEKCYGSWTQSPLAVNGSDTVTVNSDTTYTIDCTSIVGNARDSVLVEVEGPPQPPSAVVVTKFGASQIDLHWADNSDNETAFDVLCEEPCWQYQGSDYDGSRKKWRVGENTITFSAGLLMPASRYCFRVRSTNLVGNSPFTGAKCATTDSALVGGSSTMEAVAEFGGTGSEPGQFDAADGVAVDASGNIIIADTENDRIQICDENGVCSELTGVDGASSTRDVSAVAVSTGFNAPEGVAVDSQGRIIVADTGNHRIAVCNPNGACTTFGIMGKSMGQFYGPKDVAVDSQDRIIVADTNNHRIQVCNSVGNCIGFGGNGDTVGHFISPGGVGVGEKDAILVADTGNHRIQVCDEWGNCGAFGRFGTNPGEFNSPSDVAMNADGLYFISDTGNERVQICDGIGNCETYLTGSEPGGIAIDGQGRVFVVNRSQDTVLVLKLVKNMIFQSGFEK